MTVKELKKILEIYDENTKILIRQSKGCGRGLPRCSPLACVVADPHDYPAIRLDPRGYDYD